MSFVTIMPGMDLDEYRQICDDLFKRNDESFRGYLTFEDFKYFTFDMEAASGAPATDIRKLSLEGSDRTWRAMFSMFDTNGDGHVTWDEAWAFLRENKP